MHCFIKDSNLLKFVISMDSFHLITHYKPSNTWFLTSNPLKMAKEMPKHVGDS